MRSGSLLVMFGIALGSFAQTGQLVREGGYWVQTVTGVVSQKRVGLLRVHTRGAVSVQGGREQIVAYTLRKRVRAHSESEARARLAELDLKTGVAGNTAVLTLHYPVRPAAGAELQLKVPADIAVAAVETHSGDVFVYDLGGDVEVKTGAGVIQMDRIGGNIQARTAGGDIRLGTIGGGARCVSGGGSIEAQRTGAESWFDTAGGEIQVWDGGGPVHASTAGGNIHVGRARASVVARTAGGRIEVREAHGLVLAANSGGSIQVGAARGVRLEATGGSIRMRGSSGALRASSDVGSILAELIPGMPLQDSMLSTGAGDITVYIPSNIALTIQAINESGRPGRIISEFPEISVAGERSRQGTLAEGAINGGGPMLKLTSTGGTIYLRRGRQ